MRRDPGPVRAQARRVAALEVGGSGAGPAAAEPTDGGTGPNEAACDRPTATRKAKVVEIKRKELAA